LRRKERRHCVQRADGIAATASMTDPQPTPPIRRTILALLSGGLLLLTYKVLYPFLVPLAWAGILAHATWPVYAPLRKRLGGRPGISALVMTLLLTAAFVLPLLWLIASLRSELSAAYAAVSTHFADGPRPLPEFMLRVPWLGDWLQGLLDQFARNPGAMKAQIGDWVEQSRDDVLNLLGSAGRNAAKFGFALLAVFFLYRDGASLLDQVQRVLRRFLGARADPYLAAVGSTITAVVYGLVLTALVQGALAGLGYWVAGVQAPASLGALTALIALIPFGAPLVWGSIGVWLLLNGKVGAGIGLLTWGALAVSWVDNLIRPLMISSVTRIPFLLVMFGVLGGAAAFGLVGLFLGPIILAVLMAVWREALGHPDPSE
jgi:predicted PurR-regulated permease PerM